MEKIQLDFYKSAYRNLDDMVAQNEEVGRWGRWSWTEDEVDEEEAPDNKDFDVNELADMMQAEAYLGKGIDTPMKIVETILDFVPMTKSDTVRCMWCPAEVEMTGAVHGSRLWRREDVYICCAQVRGEVGERRTMKM
eukprot:65429-Hanusia_phi.AAC.4